MISGKASFRAVLTTGHKLKNNIELRMVHRP